MRTTTLLFDWRSLRHLLPILLLTWLPRLVNGQSANVVISRVYGAGGNGGATYNQDFVELFNRSASPVTVAGWSIQYAPAGNAFGGTNTSYVLPNVTIPAGSYYLVGIGPVSTTAGAAIGADQSATNITGGLAATAGKVALANNATTVTYTAPTVFSANAVDVIGYGSTASAYEGSAPAPGPTTTTSVVARANNGCTDTNNNNSDFAVVAFSSSVVPRNAGTAVNSCNTPFLVANTAALSFSAPTGQVATTATYTLAGSYLSANTSVSISSSDPAVLVSTTGAAGSFARTASTTTTASGTLAQTVTVQFTAPATVGTTTATISNTDGTRTATVSVTGNAVMAYTWNGSVSTSYSLPANWTPTRTTPGSADILVFDGTSTSAPTVVLDYSATQTIGQLLFSNNVAATLSTNGDRTLTVDNNLPGDDFAIGAGSTVTVINNTTAANSGLDILLTSSETAVISGTLIFAGNASTTNGRHTLQATGTGAIQFLSGSVFRAADTYSAVSPFGSSTTSSVIFRNGARFEQFGGSTPFGTNSNPSIVVASFEPSSYFLFASTSFPSLTNRTYGTLAYNISGTSTASVSGPVTIQGDLLALSGTANLNITGTIFLQGSVQVSTTAALNFGANSSSTVVQLSGAATQTIGSTGATTAPTFGPNTTLAINNATGVTLAVPITVPGTLQLTNGLLNTTVARCLTLPATANVSAGSNTSFVNGPVIRSLGVGNNYLFPLGKGAGYRPVALTITAPTSTTYFYRAEQFEGNPGQNLATGSGLTRVSSIRSFTITSFTSAADASNPTAIAAQITGFSGTATLSFGSDDGVTDPTQLVIAKRPDAGSAWTNAGYSNSSASSVTSAAFSTFSDFALASTNPATTTNPLPVVLTSFGAVRQASGAVQMRWATASEQHSAYFEVQRSLDGRTFITVDKVAANGTTTQAHTYASLDAAAPASLLYYRLRQVDTDGTSTFSPVVTLAAAEAATSLTLFPNPAHSYLTVNLVTGEEVQVLDLTGRTLQKTIIPPSGQLSVETLPVGTYLLRVLVGGQPRMLRFTKE